MKLKKRKYILCFFILIGLLIVVISLINYKKSSALVINHRLQWWIDDIKVEKVWNRFTGNSIKIAVIDTGIDEKHPDLINSIAENIQLDKNIVDDEKYYHGTTISGIISANPANKEGVSGVAPNSKIVSINISSENVNKGLDYLVQAINYAIDRKVDIINISMGVKSGSDELYDAVKRASEKNILVIAAAGNEGRNADVLYPAKYNEVISVGSYDKNRRIIDEFNNSRDITIYAPGINILTTNLTSKSNLYTSISGTSASSAIISGIMALVKEANPGIKNSVIIKYLLNRDQVGLDAEKILSDLSKQK